MALFQLVKLVRAFARCCSLVVCSAKRTKGSEVVVLMYHRVVGDSGLELDIDSEVFRRQLEWLKENCQVLSLDTLVDGEFLNSTDGQNSGKPKVVLTFDDAYLDFYEFVWPLLKKMQLPATLYAPTGYLENPSEVPLSDRSSVNKPLLPVTWAMLEELHRCPLITIGAHSHSHREFPSLSSAEIKNELITSDAYFERYLGYKPKHFAYPRGAWDEASQGALGDRYQSHTLVSGGVADLARLHPRELPRVPVLRSDGFFWFKQRVWGRLALEEKLFGVLRKLSQRRRAGY